MKKGKQPGNMFIGIYKAERRHHSVVVPLRSLAKNATVDDNPAEPIFDY